MSNPKKKSATKLRRTTPTVDDYNKLETKVIVHEEIKEFKKELYSDLDNRFKQVDKRFEQVDKRFDQIDKRFEGFEKKMIGFDAKLWGIFAAILIAAVVNLLFK